MSNRRSIVGGRPGGRRVRALAGLVAAGLLLGASPASAATTPYGVNLVKNPGAEAGLASPDGLSVVPIPHWELGIQFTVVKYGTAGFPTHVESVRIGGHKQFFFAGPDNGGSCDGTSQDILVKGRGKAIDHGHVRLSSHARIGSADGDSARVQVNFFDGSGNAVTTPHSNPLVVGPVTSNNKLLLKSKSKIVPKGTRKLRVLLLTDSAAGDCRGYFDNVSAVLSFAP